MPKATFFESAICGKRTVNCYSATRLTVAPNKRFYMLANKRARITGWQLRLLLYKGRRGCCIFLTQYSSGSNEKVSQRSEICLKSLLVGLHLERCSSRVWNPRISIFKLSLIPTARTAAFYLRRNRFWRKNEFWKANSTPRRLWKDGQRKNTTESHGTFPKAQQLWCFRAIWNVAESGLAD